MKLTSIEILKVLDTLIGKVEPIGETNVDKERLENFKTLVDITNWCLDEVKMCAEHKSDFEYSCSKIGLEAEGALLEYKEWIEEVLNA